MVNLLDDLSLDWQTDLQKDFIVLTDSIAVRTQYFRVKLSNKWLQYGMIGFFFRLGEMIIDGVQEVDQEVVGIVLLIASELSKLKITGERL